MELFDYSVTVPNKGNKIPYDVLTLFRSMDLPAERDNFASSADRLGSKALTDILQKNMNPSSPVKIEKKYIDFFATVKTEGKLDSIINWQEYSDIKNAQDFFKQISVLPNMPQMSSISTSEAQSATNPVTMRVCRHFFYIVLYSVFCPFWCVAKIF